MNRRQFLKTSIGTGMVAGTLPLTGRLRPAGAQNPYDRYRVVTDRLNGRSGPGLGHDVVVVYVAEQILEIAREPIESADGYVWRLVNTKPGPVWVAEEFIEPVGGDQPQDRVEVADGPLNVRAQPTIASEIRATVATGAQGTVLNPEAVEADGYSWIFVSFGDVAIGWVALEFLTYIDVG